MDDYLFVQALVVNQMIDTLMQRADLQVNKHNLMELFHMGSWIPSSLINQWTRQLDQ